MVLWCSGYHICLTRRRSPVRNRAAPGFLLSHGLFFFSFLDSKKVEMRGIEPQTSYMQSKRSTTELHPHSLSKNGCDGRVVKALDLKSNGSFPRRFESCSQRNFGPKQSVAIYWWRRFHLGVRARLAQSVEHQTFNLRVKGSSPLLGALFLGLLSSCFFY